MIFTILECPLNRIRLISSEDVSDSSATHGSASFSSLISLVPLFSEGFFFSSRIPNMGSLTFREQFVIVGMTTQGYRVSDNNYYVSEFTFQHSNSTSTPFQTYKNVRT